MSAYNLRSLVLASPSMRVAYLVCVLSLIHATVCADEPIQVYLNEGELNYVGYLDEQANQRLFALYDGLKDKPTVLAVRSRGGDVVPGMELGSWVHAHKLDVKVMEFCLSSCANYVFTAGARKIVGSNAMIGFHGGLSSTGFIVGGSKKKEYETMTADQKAAFQAELRRDIRPLLDRETAFFKSIGVRQDITTYGQQARFAKIIGDGWTFTQDGFRHFSVDNIEVINPPWAPRLLTVHANFTTLTAQ
jgi:ATP-dependent protease ClpP protease subunit